jgi:hypothetical protein
VRIAIRTSRSVPKMLIGLIPIPESGRIFLPSSRPRYSISPSAAGVPCSNSIPA